MQPLSVDDPEQIGRYRLRNRLGAGGMGRVYLASTPAGRPVALKVVRPELSDDQEFRARFRQEIQAAQRVRGLYTAELVDADPEADPPWLATAYVPGPSLQQVLNDQGTLPEAEAFRVIAGVAEALQAIHAAGVVHRDLKPSNVVLGPDGPRVIDFGIARALETTAWTRTGMAVGTPQFMAPEQLQDLPVTPMIDVFALGTLAAYAAGGKPPFGGGHPSVVYYRIIHEPADLSGCPPQMRALIEPCLAKQPADRPQLGQIIDYCLENADLPAQPASTPPPYQPTEMNTYLPPAPAPTVLGGAAPQPVSAVTPARIVPPPSIINAVRLIYVGAVITACGMAVGLLSASGLLPIPAVVPAAMKMNGASPGTIALASVSGGLVASLIWVWMARVVKRGWSKARVAAATLFALNTIAIVSTSASGITDRLSFLFNLAEWGVGLLAIVSLWDRRSTEFFTALVRARSFVTPEWPKKAALPAGGPRHGKR